MQPDLHSFHVCNGGVTGVALAGILAVLHSCLDLKATIGGSQYHHILYFLTPAMKPRMLMTVDKDMNLLPVSVRVGQAVDVVAQVRERQHACVHNVDNDSVKLPVTDLQVPGRYYTCLLMCQRVPASHGRICISQCGVPQSAGPLASSKLPRHVLHLSAVGRNASAALSALCKRHDKVTDSGGLYRLDDPRRYQAFRRTQHLSCSVLGSEQSLRHRSTWL